MSNGDHNIKDDGGESHHPEEAFLSGPLREMQAGSRQNTLAYGYPPPETTFQTTLGGLRTRLHDLRTVEKPMDGMESTMHDLFSAIRADKMELYAQENASVADDNASSVAVEDHASDKSPSETDSATAQHDADMQEIDAAELAWTRLMATLRKLDDLRGRSDVREELKGVLRELQAMRGTFN
ncbi:hypothetical protein R3P38DRAFT_3187802 [Favolaschia claudopus]|uniref:Uncharacterized protein n=1 Tax=Favolaschia claudopus TaxID=2862362 RepID=A0AAW0BCW7_9AGAR